MLDGLASDRDGVRHIVLDLRSWAPVGCVRLIRQHDYARQNRHNLAVVRGPEAIERLLALTAVQELLVLVDDPADLVPRPSASPGG